MTTTDETEANRAAVTAAFEAWRDEHAPITSVFAPNMTWRIVGRSAASRDYADTQQFVDEVLAPFGRRFSTNDPFRPVDIRGIYADGASVIAYWQGRGTTVAGTVYDNTYAWFMELRDGKVIDGTALFDRKAFDELWTGVDPA